MAATEIDEAETNCRRLMVTEHSLTESHGMRLNLER